MFAEIMFSTDSECILYLIILIFMKQTLVYPRLASSQFVAEAGLEFLISLCLSRTGITDPHYHVQLPLVDFQASFISETRHISCKCQKNCTPISQPHLLLRTGGASSEFRSVWLSPFAAEVAKR